MKKIWFILSVVVFLFGVGGCEKTPTAPVVPPPETVCNVANPLTDLTWLSQTVTEIENSTMPVPARIYQCTYRDGIGFLIARCFECPDAGFDLTDCQGRLLCICFGHAGDMCTEFAVDFENKQLIYSHN